MADQKISQLNNIAGANVAADDEMVIVDTDAGETKAIRVDNIRAAVGLATTDSPTFAGLTVDTNTLYVDSANNRVGIGTTSPGYPLEVNGVIKTKFESGGAGVATMGSATASGIVLTSSDSAAGQYGPQVEAKNTYSSGSGGPYWNSTKTRGSGPASSGDALGSFVFRSADTGNTLRNAAFFTALSAGAGASHHAASIDFQTVDTSGVNSSRMRITSEGKVGIGTTSPNYSLHVEGGSAYTAIGLTTTGSTQFLISSGDASTNAVGEFRWDTGGLGRWSMRKSNAAETGSNAGSNFQIDARKDDGSYLSTPLVIYRSNGNVSLSNTLHTYFGKVGINETAPDYKLDVNGTFGFTPGSSVTPVDNGDVVFELTNNTTLTIKAKGSDGTVRSGTITLA